LLPSLIVEGIIVSSLSGEVFPDSVGMMCIARKQKKQDINSYEAIQSTRTRHYIAKAEIISFIGKTAR
jgi:hypothetical protein